MFEEGFEGAEDEIRNAYERRRKGDNKNAILEAGKAFESTMKIICDKQGYCAETYYNFREQRLLSKL